MNELTRVENDLPAPTPTEALMASKDPMWIMQLAIERGITDVGALERYTDLCLKMQAIKAKGDYDRAMSAFQAECPTIYKRKEVEQLYKYAPLEDIIEQVKVLIQKHGFSYKFGSDVKSEAGFVVATCKVTHEGGHSEQSEMKLPIAAGTRAMDATKNFASAMTFATRRVFQNSFGIVCAGEDMDGRIPGERAKPKNPSSMAPDDSTLRTIAISLWEVLRPVRGTAKNWIKSNEWLRGVAILKDGEELPNIPKERYEQMIEASKRQLKAEEKP